MQNLERDLKVMKDLFEANPSALWSRLDAAERELGSSTDEPNPNGSVYARLRWWKDRNDVLHDEIERLREALTLHRFEHVLRKHSIVDTAAFDDPNGYDNHETLSAIRAAHREMTDFALSPIGTSKLWIPIIDRKPTASDMPVMTLERPTENNRQGRGPAKESLEMAVVFHESWFKEENLEENGIVYWWPINPPSIPI
jgi:hypothetical protein